MRAITQNAINAFLSAQKFRNNNTVVEVKENVTVLKLHGHSIAFLYNNPERTLSVTNCGWFTNTTKERLNALPGVKIQQKKGIWFLNGQEWSGELIDIKK